jgi:hypothetical protein
MKPARQKRKQKMFTVTNKDEAAEPKKGPVDRIRLNGITATFWENQGEDGQIHTSVTVERNYKAGDTWKTTNSYDIRNIASLHALTGEIIRKFLFAEGHDGE